MRESKITKEEKIGVILSKIYCILSNSPLSDKPI